MSIVPPNSLAFVSLTSTRCMIRYRSSSVTIYERPELSNGSHAEPACKGFRCAGKGSAAAAVLKQSQLLWCCLCGRASRRFRRHFIPKFKCRCDADVAGFISECMAIQLHAARQQQQTNCSLPHIGCRPLTFQASKKQQNQGLGTSWSMDDLPENTSSLCGVWPWSVPWACRPGHDKLNRLQSGIQLEQPQRYISDF